MSDLRKRLIRLAHSKPELRKDLLPLLKTADAKRLKARKRIESMFEGWGFTNVFIGASGGNRVDISYEPPARLEDAELTNLRSHQFLYRALKKEGFRMRNSDFGPGPMVSLDLSPLMKTATWTRYLKACGNGCDGNCDDCSCGGNCGCGGKEASTVKLARREGFDLEVADTGIRTAPRGGWGYDINLWYPLSNIGRRGKKVKHYSFFINLGQQSSTAWGHTFLSRVRRKRSFKGVLNALHKMFKDEVLDETPAAQIHENSPYEYKGVDKSLPTPKALIAQNIKGADIFVDMNAKPISISSKRHSAELMKSYETYWLHVHHRFRKRLMALSRQLEAAKSLDAAEKILGDAKIPYDYRRYMMPGWD